MKKILELNQLTKIREEELYSSTPNWLPIDLSAIDTSPLQKLNLNGCQLTLVCGISTAGKDTLVHSALQLDPHLKFLPRATSRPTRPGEREGVDYFFNVENALMWSEYAGNVYAVTDQVLTRLAEQKRSIQVQGLLYGFVLRELLTPFGVNVNIVYILPELLSTNILGSLRVVLDRLYTLYPDQADDRLPSILRELRFVFEYLDELKRRGVHFIENPPTARVPDPKVVQHLLELS